MEGEPRPISGEVRLSGESLGPTRTTMFFKEQIHIHTTGMSVQIETLKMHIFLIKLVSDKLSCERTPVWPLLYYFTLILYTLQSPLEGFNRTDSSVIYVF